MTRGEERGAATVLVVAVAGLLLMIGLAVGGVAAVVVTHRAAQSAADLAALAGAGAAATGNDACTAAGVIARANDARLTSCTVEVSDVVVQVSRIARPGFGLSFDLTADARAGPG